MSDQPDRNTGRPLELSAARVIRLVRAEREQLERRHKQLTARLAHLSDLEERLGELVGVSGRPRGQWSAARQALTPVLRETLEVFHAGEELPLSTVSYRLGIQRSAASQRLRSLVNLGALTASGMTNARRYRLAEEPKT